MTRPVVSFLGGGELKEIKKIKSRAFFQETQAGVSDKGV
jgi:hypothetical protein